ncbi:MAG: Uma2 family endonuclease [Candidatus Sulfopaludibacter sp.]|nr:Uma2 family endonuclease [Candidatus Sulfopaludibacter sp.]
MAALPNLITVEQFRQMPDDGRAYELHHGEVVAEFDLRVADVAVVSQARHDGIDPDDNLRGAPELVIEVKSPSNTDRKLRELASLSLANGGVECWIIDIESGSVTVSHRDGSSLRYRAPETIPLAAFGGGELAIVEILS